MNNLKVITLGGVNEIGKNITAYEYEDTIVLIDCGASFPDPQQMGVSLIIPDFSYLLENSKKIKGLVITHAHEDHIGSITYLINQLGFTPKIYGSKFTLEMIRFKLIEAGIVEKHGELIEINENSKINLSPFELEFIHVNHSIPESMAIAINTPVGRVIHTGDLRIDLTPTGGQKPTDIQKFSLYGKQGVKLLVTESTNAERPGFSLSETEVIKSLSEIYLHHKENRIIISTFASNINRIKSIIEVSEDYGRKIAFTGRSMVKIVDMAIDKGYVYAPKSLFVDIYEAQTLPPEKVTIITTGSQGEVMSALQRMSVGEHKEIALSSRDTVILSSSAIPGNEKLVNNVVNTLILNNVEVIKAPEALVHVSGHAYRDELKLLMTMISPEYIIPVHGEAKHLYANKANAMALGYDEENIIVPSVGSIVEVGENTFEETGKVQAGAVLIEGPASEDISPLTLNERRSMAQSGAIIVILQISYRQKTLIADPDVVAKGFMTIKDSSDIMFNLKKAAKEAALNSITVDDFNWRTIKKNVQSTLSRYVYTKTKRSPLIIPIIVPSK